MFYNRKLPKIFESYLVLNDEKHYLVGMKPQC